MNVFIFIRPIFVLLILAVFIVRLLLVSLYQQRSGDYFPNKMVYRYSKKEIGNASIHQRKAVMLKANWLTALWWWLLIILAALSTV